LEFKIVSNRILEREACATGRKVTSIISPKANTTTISLIHFAVELVIIWY
jgi:hypothetical protein